MSKLKVIKRDGLIKDFDESRIISAVKKAYEEAELEVNIDILGDILKKVQEVGKDKERLSVEEIQDVVVDILKKEENIVGELYEKYRLERNFEREKNSEFNKLVNKTLNCLDVQNSNANVDESSFGGRKFECAGALMRQHALNFLIPKDIADAHRKNQVYQHDLDSYSIGEHNCAFVDGKTLINETGFSTRNGDVRPSKNLETALQLLAVIFQIQSQEQYGGVGLANYDYELEEQVNISFRKLFSEVIEDDYNKFIYWEDLPEEIHIENEDELTEKYPEIMNKVMKKLNKMGLNATIGLYHNLNTLESRPGSQVPFTSINLGLRTTNAARLLTKWVFEASLDGIGEHHRTSIFPISIFQYSKGINSDKGDPNYDLKQLAIKSMTHRIYPNWVNNDWSNNVYDPNNPETAMSTMG